MSRNNTYLAVFLGSRTGPRREAWDALPEGGPTALELAAGPRGPGSPGHTIRLLQRRLEDQRQPFREPGPALRDSQRIWPDGSTADEKPLVGPAPGPVLRGRQNDQSEAGVCRRIRIF